MAELIHVSRIRIVKDKGPVRRAFIEAFPEPVRYGVHGGVKKFYGVEPEEELPTTLDHIIAAVAGWMTGTLAVALAARKIPTQPDRLSSEVEGFIENVEGKPIITKIKVHYKVKAPHGKREEALRAIEVHEKGCPASQSVRRGIAIEWDGDIEEVWPLEIEQKVNLEVASARPIRVSFLPRDESDRHPDPIRTKVNLLPPDITAVRVVEIEGLDVQADGGTHVASTHEVGRIRIVGHKSKGRINKRIEISLH